MSRLYQPVWELIKRDKSADLEVHRVYVARVKKAVRKEKDMDQGFKLLKAEEGMVCELVSTYDPKKSILSFSLKETCHIGSL